MANLEQLKYTKSHEWVLENEDGTVTVGADRLCAAGIRRFGICKPAGCRR